MTTKLDKKTTHQTWLVYTDGACRGNPGPSGAGIYAITIDGSILLQESFYLGQKTNNQAEYLALAFAAFLIKNLLNEQDQQPIVFFVLDSELIVRQMTGKYKVKDHVLAQIKQSIDFLLQDISPQFKHVLRHKNVAADALANQAIDKKVKIPQKLLKFATDHRLPL
ncbi:MAG: ribonuclease HI family protein [bacterium]